MRNLKRLLCLLLVLTMLPINAFASDIIVPGSGGTSPGSGGGGSGTKWSSPTNLGPGMLLHVQQGGEQGRSRSMQFPAAGYLHFGDWSPWELRHSHALRGIGQGTRDQSTTRGTRAQKPSARSREGIKRQGADFLSRSPVLFSPLARLPVPSCCFLIGCRQKPWGAVSCYSSKRRVPQVSTSSPAAARRLSRSRSTRQEKPTVTRMLSLSMGATTLAGPSWSAR